MSNMDLFFQTYYTEKLQEQMDFLTRDGGDAEAEKLWAKLKGRTNSFRKVL